MTLDKCNQREVAKVLKLISKILKITENCKSDTQKRQMSKHIQSKSENGERPDIRVRKL